jgi:hypothetical protein
VTLEAGCEKLNSVESICIVSVCVAFQNQILTDHLKGQSRFHIHSNKLFKGIINKKGTCSKSSDDDDDDAYFVLNQYIEEDQSSMTKVTSAS